MRELIDKQEAITMPVMPKEHRTYQTLSVDGVYEQGWHDCQTCIEDLPSAQPEFIRCKKCKHWTRTCGNEQWGLGDCDVFDKHFVMCEGYCAWAERREE